MPKVTIMSLAVHIIDKNRPQYTQYAVTFYFSGERTQRRLKDNYGPIRPSKGAYVINGENGPEFFNEKPGIVARVFTASNIMSNKLGDEGALSVNGKYKYGKEMKKYICWRNKHRSDPEFEKHSKASLDEFGDKRMNAIKYMDVQNWIDEKLAPRYADNTIRNKVGVGIKLYNWMKKRGIWSGKNPFSSHEWNAANEGLYIKSSLSNEEWNLIKKLSIVRPQLHQAVTLAYYLGLRPSEIYRILPEDFNHKELILKVRVKKTGKYTRLVAIPKELSNLVLSWNWETMNEKYIQNRIQEVRKQHTSLDGLTMESFRRNYISMMELAGCPIEHVEAHQGRYQSSVSKQHYLKDKYRAVKLMQPFMDVFESDKYIFLPLRRIK